MSRRPASWINTDAARPRVYTEWTEIGPGEVHPRIFRMDEVFRVRASIRTWNSRHHGVLSVRRFLKGTAEHPEPHFRVGWDASHTFDPAVIRTAPKRIAKRKKAVKRKD